MTGARVAPAKAITTKEVRENYPESGSAELNEMRRIAEQHSQELASLRKQVDELLSREASLKEMLATAATERAELYRRNEDIYAALYTLRAGEAGSDYRRLISRVREIVRGSLPYGATVLVAAKGDDELLRLYGRKAWHFPQTENGTYAGHHPASGMAAIAHLEALRARGADYFLLPATMFWWLDHYSDFKRYLETYYSVVAREDTACLIFALRKTRADKAVGWQPQLYDAVALCQRHFGEKPSILDCTGLKLAARFPDLAIFSPAGTDRLLPYVDESVDLVAISSNDSLHSGEARRVAKTAVLMFSQSELDIDWKQNIAPGTVKVSIVIPCGSDVAETEACLAAVAESLPHNLNGEIIVVDAVPEASERLERAARSDPRVRILRNRKAKDFLTACNSGAKSATGDILLFVNSAVLPLAGWFSPFLDLLRDRPAAGAAGGKLLYPDGTVQEAGAVVSADGSLEPAGDRDTGTHLPAHNYVRDVHYCSAVFLATRHSVFDEVNGFDAGFSSLDYAGADYGLRIRAKGYQFLYQPEAAAVYAPGHDGHHDRTNRNRLMTRWAATLDRFSEKKNG
jgi:GT2 family glycosyltransferase